MTIRPEALGDGPGSTGAYRLTIDTLLSTTECSNEPDDVLATATETGISDLGMYICTFGTIGDGECFRRMGIVVDDAVALEDVGADHLRQFFGGVAPMRARAVDDREVFSGNLVEFPERSRWRAEMRH